MTTTTIELRGVQGCYGDIALTVDLPALEGSAKQVAWATDLRISAIRTALARLVESPAAVAALPKVQAAGLLTALAAEIEARTSAAVWIEARGATDGLTILRAAMARLRASKTG